MNDIYVTSIGVQSFNAEEGGKGGGRGGKGQITPALSSRDIVLNRRKPCWFYLYFLNIYFNIYTFLMKNNPSYFNYSLVQYFVTLFTNMHVLKVSHFGAISTVINEGQWAHRSTVGTPQSVSTSDLVPWYRVFIKCCFFSEILKIFRTLFSLGASLCTQSRQVKNQRCCRTGRVQKNHKILRKKHNI